MRCYTHAHEKCTKEVSFRVAGSKELARRMLLTWTIWGPTVETKEEHKALWPLVVQDQCAGLLLPMDTLEAMVRAQTDSGCVAVAPRAARPSLLLRQRAADVCWASDTQMSRGLCMRDVCSWPYRVSADSTQAERSLCRQSIGKVVLGVPAAFMDARDYGYVHPHLPPPIGFVWRINKRGHWALIIQCG